MSTHLLGEIYLIVAVLAGLGAAATPAVKAWISYLMFTKAIENVEPDKRAEIIRAFRQLESRSPKEPVSPGQEALATTPRNYQSIARFLRRNVRDDASPKE